MDVLGLRGKVAVVTGGGGNIGTATVRLLGQLGANVLVADVNIETAENAAAEARENGADAVAVMCDTRRPEDIERMVEVARDRWDRLDVGVNIVGGGDGMGKSALELTDEEWEASVETEPLFGGAMLPRVRQGHARKQHGGLPGEHRFSGRLACRPHRWSRTVPPRLR